MKEARNRRKGDDQMRMGIGFDSSGMNQGWNCGNLDGNGGLQRTVCGSWLMVQGEKEENARRRCFGDVEAGGTIPDRGF